MACSTSPRFAASHSKAPLIAKICHSARNCAERQISIRHASLAHQPAVHDLPLVLTSWSKIQKRRSRLLQLKKEFKRIPGARRLGIDGLRLDPSVPLPDNQRLCVLLSHPTHARSNDELSTCEDGNVRANDYKIVPSIGKDGLKHRPVVGGLSDEFGLLTDVACWQFSDRRDVCLASRPPAGFRWRLIRATRSGLTPTVRTAGPSASRQVRQPVRGARKCASAPACRQCLRAAAR